MKRRILQLCQDLPIVRIEHIGSTAVKGIWAKPIIDILVEIDGDLVLVSKRLQEAGFICMNESRDRISLNLGYTIHGFASKVYHIHLRHVGDHDEIFFRNYLRKHPETAKSYQKLKLELWRQYEHDRDGYTNAKTDFVRRYTELAKKSNAA